MQYKIYGLERGELRQVKAQTNGDLVATTETFAIGGGEWAIECRDERGYLVREFVGSNGTRDEADDLWAEYAEWAKQIARPAYSYREWIAPDGTKGSKSFFFREIERGRLHGCTVRF